MSSLDDFDFRQDVLKLKEMRGRHTELVSVYVPEGYDIRKMVGQLQQEQGTAVNIKSTSTRKNVLSALERIIQHLNLFKQTPEHGLCVFAGNISEREGKEDIQIFSIIPPLPLNMKLYRCDQKFYTGPLEDMMKAKNVYALLLIDRSDAVLAYLKGKHIQVVKTWESIVPGKFRAGGQSAARFGRVIENMAKDFYKEVGEEINKLLRNTEDLKGIIIGGPGPTKENFINAGYVAKEFRDKIIGVKDTGYANERGLEELLERSKDVLQDAEISDEKEILSKFFTLLGKDGAVTYGESSVKKGLEMGAVETVIVSEDIKKKDDLGEEQDLIHELAKMAKETGANVEVVSKYTEEGAMFYQIGGIGAILRYKIDL